MPINVRFEKIDDNKAWMPKLLFKLEERIPVIIEDFEVVYADMILASWQPPRVGIMACDKDFNPVRGFNHFNYYKTVWTNFIDDGLAKAGFNITNLEDMIFALRIESGGQFE